MNILIGVLIPIVTVVIAFASFLFGRSAEASNKRKEAKDSGQEWGELLSDVKHIKGSVDEVKNDTQSVRKELSDERRERRESNRRLHERLDDHEKRLSRLEGNQE